MWICTPYKDMTLENAKTTYRAKDVFAFANDGSPTSGEYTLHGELIEDGLLAARA